MAVSRLTAHLRDTMHRSAYALIAGSVVTSVLVFAFRLLAARLYAPTAVGAATEQHDTGGLGREVILLDPVQPDEQSGHGPWCAAATLSKAQDQGGLGIGTYGASAVLLGLLVICLCYQIFTRRRQTRVLAEADSSQAA